MTPSLPAWSPAPTPGTPEFAEHARQQYRLLKIGVLSMLVLACALPLSLNLVDPDLWGHVQYANDWMAAGQMPRTATHTYSAEGHPWVNHEIAAEFALAWGANHLGIHPMLVLKCLLGLAIASAMAWTARRHGAATLAVWSLLLLVCANLQAFFPLRPQLLSFALCTVALVCLDRAFEPWTPGRRIRFAWLWPLPLVFAAWVNSHGGFVAGLCIVGAYLLGRMVELALREGRASFGRQVHLAAVGLLCVAATGANPYGWGMHLWLWNTWGGAPPEITEWAPPLPGTPVFWPLVALLVVAAGALAGTRRRRDWTHIVVLALVAWQACSHLRHIAFLALLCGFWLPVHWHSALQRLRPDADRKLPIMRPPAWMRAALGAVILLGISLQSLALGKRLSDFPVLRSHYPVDALQFMADHRLGGKTVVAFNWAQYAIAALAPQITVQFDGRFDTCYPQEVIDMHFDWLLGDVGPRERSAASGPIDGTRVLEHGQPDLVLAETRYKTTRAIMQAEAARENPAWVLLYSDSVAELWGRASRYDDPASPHYFPPEHRTTGLRLLEASWQWPALPDRSLWDEADSAASTPAPTEASDRFTVR
ncbi:MAG TPA: hypothetical protein VEQ85_07285 [Lacipirellulaceae bacterium]|nr:hypothetical protein [Lacipirellulaceae bacterium]